jgi:protein-S-isoprenylcysteine O-methyltransferase Ste14
VTDTTDPAAAPPVVAPPAAAPAPALIAAPAVAVSRPDTSSKLPSYIGILIILLVFGLLAAILFVKKADGVSDAVIQQIITSIIVFLGVYGGWQYGSSQSSQRKDDTIATITKT